MKVKLTLEVGVLIWEEDGKKAKFLVTEEQEVEVDTFKWGIAKFKIDGVMHYVEVEEKERREVVGQQKPGQWYQKA